MLVWMRVPTHSIALSHYLCSGFNHVFGAPRALVEPGDDIVSSAPARPAVEILYFAGP